MLTYGNGRAIPRTPSYIDASPVEVGQTLHLPRCVAELEHAAITGGSRAVRFPKHRPLLWEGDQA